MIMIFYFYDFYNNDYEFFISVIIKTIITNFIFIKIIKSFFSSIKIPQKSPPFFAKNKNNIFFKYFFDDYYYLLIVLITFLVIFAKCNY